MEVQHRTVRTCRCTKRIWWHAGKGEWLHAETNDPKCNPFLAASVTARPKAEQ
ncbi:hypothetical protein [Pseudonocardia lacus]|uniref:hypothetical protein n=1 Tax=Pseudonocardia lacus TaxID=2835865 RepID=UPI001BDC8655|nr:hypothetical protein [Pseudonocardia lacus]